VVLDCTVNCQGANQEDSMVTNTDSGSTSAASIECHRRIAAGGSALVRRDRGHGRARDGGKGGTRTLDLGIMSATL
jgi:hypothetical protein